jgi:hypothetical protein
MSDDDIRQLLVDGAIEQVEPDPETAAGELAVARSHLTSAELITDQDPSGAFALGYDAMRKASPRICAHAGIGWQRGLVTMSARADTRLPRSMVSASRSTSRRSMIFAACGTSPNTTL